MRRIVPILLLLALPLSLDAQTNPSDIRLRLAQSYEKSGDFESALRVYHELFASDSGNFSLIESLKRCHLKLKQHDEVIALIDHSLRLHPRDIGALSQLGNVWFLKGDESRALDAWQRAVAVDPNDETAYRVVGSSMVQVRQFERAAETYRAARKNLGKPTAFASDIAYLYGVMQKFRESTEEYIVLLRETPSQLAYIQSRIASFTGNEAGLKEAGLAVGKAVKSDQKNIELRRLLAWLSMEAKDYDDAFETYRQIDALTSSGGKELFIFAERALNEKSYTAASRAYSEVIDRNPSFRDLPRARYGLARSLEELGVPAQPGDTSIAARYSRATGMYARIVFDHPHTDIAARALLRLALIKRERLSDPEGARDYLEKISREYKIFLPTAVEAKLALGEVYIELDDLDRAASTLSEVAGPPPFGGADREKAALRLAELRFYTEDYQGALTILSDLMKNAVSDAANDAIPLQMLISEYRKEDAAGLEIYASARLLRAQRRYADALGILDDALKADTSGALRDRYAFMKGEILSGMKRSDEAIGAFSLIIDRLPESLLRDRAMFAVAGLCETAKADRLLAIGMYERLLEKYPNSIHANAARKRIRELRGDSI
ncbi:MAG TPA: tetratricopeptide repeat protein [Bacteroidota bacterium]|nr:tetratricopeptide repeat protein [Bacteroidota bacterium]